MYLLPVTVLSILLIQRSLASIDTEHDNQFNDVLPSASTQKSDNGFTNVLSESSFPTSTDKSSQDPTNETVDNITKQDDHFEETQTLNTNLSEKDSVNIEEKLIINEIKTEHNETASPEIILDSNSKKLTDEPNENVADEILTTETTSNVSTNKNEKRELEVREEFSSNKNVSHQLEINQKEFPIKDVTNTDEVKKPEGNTERRRKIKLNDEFNKFMDFHKNLKSKLNKNNPDATIRTRMAPSEDLSETDIPNLGRVRGSISSSFRKNNKIFCFRSIPFAQSPVGPRRFQMSFKRCGTSPRRVQAIQKTQIFKAHFVRCTVDIVIPLITYNEHLARKNLKQPNKRADNWESRKAPLTRQPWLGVLDATKQGRMCPQRGSYDTNDDGDPEDCLHLNVFTTTLNPEAKRAVVVYVHGGDFLSGSSAPYGPEYLLDEDVVLVVPQYRLGALGFLSMQSKKIPGNAGFLDVIAALQWVQEHITAFGGDPQRVTVFGLNSGGVLASLLLVSPPAQGLFNALICQSGNYLTRSMFEPNPTQYAVDIANVAGCTGNKLDKCVLSLSAKALVEASLKFLEDNIRNGGDGRRGLCPVVQRTGRINALPAPPSMLMQTNPPRRVPLIVGTSIHDGVSFFKKFYDEYLNYTGLIYDKNFLRNELTEYIFRVSGIDNRDPHMMQTIQDLYVPGVKEGNCKTMLPGIVDLFGQFWTKASSHLLAELNAYTSPCYYFSFAYSPDKTNMSVVDHEAHTKYLFPMQPFKTPEEEGEVSRQLVQLISNFAKYGNPTPENYQVSGVPTWPSYDVQTIPLSYPFLMMKDNCTIVSDISSEFDVAVREGVDLCAYFAM